MINSEQIQLVQTSFEKIIPIRDVAAEIFYADLFETAPRVKPYFANANMAEQGKKLMATLGVVVKSLDNLDAITPVARELAIRHVDYGVQAKDYPIVGEALIRTLEKGLGEDFTPETKAAWGEAYALISDVMIKAAYPQQ